MLAQEVVNTVVQLMVVLVIALIFWLIFGRKKAGYFRWIGLYLPTRRSLVVTLLVFLVWSVMTTAFFFLPELKEAAAAENTVAGNLRAEGFSTEIIIVIFVVAGFKTALSEEIFFRGLFAKRLINGLGFWIGNTVHAFVFGAIHLLIFVVPGGPEFTLFLGAALLIVPGVAGWLMAWLNEKAGNGSIAPGWMLHALGNATSYPILAFVV